MGFYDDLKKPEQETKKKTLQFVVSAAERQKFADILWYEIREACKSAKSAGNRGCCSYYVCTKSEGYWLSDNHPYCSLDCRSYKKASDIRYGKSRGGHSYDFEKITAETAEWTASERDKILPLLRAKLVSEGFPGDAVSAHDDASGSVGYGIFKHGGQPVYTIKADIRW